MGHIPVRFEPHVANDSGGQPPLPSVWRAQRALPEA